MKFTFLVTDETVNNYGFRILTDGIDTTQFEKNPVGYYMHQRRSGTDFNADGDEVICKWENIQKLPSGAMLADAIFDETNEKSMKIAKKIDKGFLKMASVGVNPIETTEDKKLLMPGQTRPTVTKSTLHEISIVDRGGNNNALVKLYDGEKQDYELPLINKPQMNLEDKLKKQLNLADDQSVETAVIALKADQGYKAKYDALVELNAATRKAEAIKLIDKAIADKKLKAERKESFISLFEKDHANAKSILEDLMGTPTAAPTEKLNDFIESITPGQGGKGADADKDWAWYELNDPEALLTMKTAEPEKFEKLFNASL